MSKTNTPMRYAIISLIDESREGLTPTQLHEALTPVYGDEKQCNLAEMDSQLMSLEICGLVEIVETHEKCDGIESSYRMTDYGRKRARKYIGKYMTEKRR